MVLTPEESGVQAPLQIIVASTRPGRVGLPVARWFEEVADRHDAFDVEWVDLAVVGLPLLDEPNHPIARKYTQPHTIAWSETVARGDAFVIVHPEYNHSYNAAIKNALDYLHAEWNYKPVGFVSYGGVSAGVRAMTALKPVVAALRMTPVIEAVNIPFVTQFIDDAAASCRTSSSNLARRGCWPSWPSWRAPSSPPYRCPRVIHGRSVDVELQYPSHHRTVGGMWSGRTARGGFR